MAFRQMLNALAPLAIELAGTAARHLLRRLAAFKTPTRSGPTQ